MGINCVNTALPEFKQLVQDTNIHESVLETYVERFQSLNNTEAFPTKEWIKAELQGARVEYTDAQEELYYALYSNPIILDNESAGNVALREAQRYFPKEAVHLTRTADNKYMLTVNEPYENPINIEKEYNKILREAPRNKEGKLLTKNKEGELVESNLNERQYAQVRSKRFKRWFGDWENDPNNASKVVDENGEPLVVYHGTNADFDTFAREKLGVNTGAPSAKMAFFASSSERLARYYAGRETTNEAIETGRMMYGEGATLEDMGIGPEEDEFAEIYDSREIDIYNMINSYSDRLNKFSDLANTPQERTISNTINKSDEWIYGEGIEDYLREGYTIVKGTIEDYNNGKSVTISKTTKEAPRVKAVGVDVYEILKDKKDLPQEAKELIEEINRKKEAIDEEYLERLDEAKREAEKNYNNHVKGVFLNIRDIKESNDFNRGYRAKSYAQRIADAASQEKDGGVIKNTKDPYPADIYYFFNENNVKSATDNNGLFSLHNNSINATPAEGTSTLEYLSEEELNDFISHYTEEIERAGKEDKQIADDAWNKKTTTLEKWQNSITENDNPVITEETFRLLYENAEEGNAVDQIIKQSLDIIHNSGISFRVVNHEKPIYGVTKDGKKIPALFTMGSDGYRTTTFNWDLDTLKKELACITKEQRLAHIKSKLMHELRHSVTSSILVMTPEQAEKAGLSEEQKSFYKDMNIIYEEAMKNKKIAELYGGTDVVEFAAEIYASGKLQKELASMPATKKVLTKFWNAISKLIKGVFGKKGVNIDKTLLDQAIRVDQEYSQYALKGLNPIDYSKVSSSASKANIDGNTFLEEASRKYNGQDVVQYGGIKRVNGKYVYILPKNKSYSTKESIKEEVKNILKGKKLLPDDFKLTYRNDVKLPATTKPLRAIEITPIEGRQYLSDTQEYLKLLDEEEELRHLEKLKQSREKAMLERDAKRHVKELGDGTTSEYDDLSTDSSKPRFDLTNDRAKVRLKKKFNWKENRGIEITATLSDKDKKAVSDNLEKYLKGRETKGESHTNIMSDYVPEGANTTEVLDNIIAKSKDKELVELAKTIKGKLSRDRKVIAVEHQGSREGTRGQFTTNNEVHLFPKATYGTTESNGRRLLEKVALHEITHSITSDALTQDKALREAVSEVMGQVNDYITKNNIRNKEALEDISKFYFFKNEKEFMSEFMSSPVLREALKHMEYKGEGKVKKTIFQKVMDSILGFFGIKPKSTLYQRAEQLFDDISKVQIDDNYNRTEDDSSVAENTTNNYPSEIPAGNNNYVLEATDKVYYYERPAYDRRGQRDRTNYAAGLELKIPGVSDLLARGKEKHEVYGIHNQYKIRIDKVLIDKATGDISISSNGMWVSGETAKTALRYSPEFKFLVDSSDKPQPSTTDKSNNKSFKESLLESPSTRVNISKLNHKDELVDVIHDVDDTLLVQAKSFRTDKLNIQIYYSKKHNRFEARFTTAEEVNPGDIKQGTLESELYNTTLTREQVQYITDRYIPKELQDYFTSGQYEKDTDIVQEETYKWKKTHPNASISEIVEFQNNLTNDANAYLRDTWGIPFINEYTDETNAFGKGSKLIDTAQNDSKVKNEFSEANVQTMSSTNIPYYEGNITPDNNTIFVFGSNPEGRHGAGAAKIAREQFGAKYGVGEGLTGNAYALPTKDLRGKVPFKRGRMTFSYGNNKRSGVKSTTTFEAIKNGERTATTRYTSDGHIEYWKSLRKGDIIEFSNANNETVLVEVTKPLTKLDSNNNAEEWSKKEGWSVDYYNNKVLPKVQKGEAFQFEYKVVDSKNTRSISPSQIIESIKKLYDTARKNPNKQFKVAYRNTDKASLNGYTGLEMIDMFKEAGEIPSNVLFSKEWIDTGRFNTPSSREFTRTSSTNSNTIDVTSTNKNGYESLSNFANRPFKIDGYSFNSVEQAFQYYKMTELYNWMQQMGFPNQAQKALDTAQAIMKSNNPYEIKKLGSTKIATSGQPLEYVNAFFEKYNPTQGAWETKKISGLRQLMLASFEQNPKALELLLSTGDAEFTHSVGGEYKTLFPKLLAEVRETLKNKPKKEAPQAPITTEEATEVQKSNPKDRFQTKLIDNSKVEVEYDKVPWAEDKSKTKVIAKIYLKGQKEKGHFELVADTNFENTEFNGEYSVHFKTATDEHPTEGIKASTTKERKILYEQLRNMIPPGAKVSTWGYLTQGGVKALEKVGKDWEMIGTRDVHDKQNNPIKIPIFQKPSTAEMSETEKFLATQSVIANQMKSLLSNPALTVTELKTLCSNVAFEISDLITQIEEDYNVAKKLDVTDEQLQKIADASSRLEIVNAIGADKLISYVKEVYTGVKTNNINTIRKASALRKNWDAVMVMAKSTLSSIENFKIDNNGILAKAIEDGAEITQDGTDIVNDNDEIREIEGSLQEHWQIEANTRSVLQDASSLIKHFFQGIPKLKIVGYEADGTPKTEEVLNEFGAKERMAFKDVTASLLNWFYDSHVSNIDDMMNCLKAKLKEEPWVKPVIEKLEDRSGKYADFQNQFFPTMFKPFQVYDVVDASTGKFNVAVVNKNNALRDLSNQVQATFTIGQLPLFTNKGVNQSTLSWLISASEALESYIKNPDSVNNIKDIVGNIYAALGIQVESNVLDAVINKNDLAAVTKGLEYLTETLKRYGNKEDFSPFEYNVNGNKNPDYIGTSLRQMLTPVATRMDVTNMNSFYSQGKMYQSYVIPSYLTNLFNTLGNKDAEVVRSYIEKEYAAYPWFVYQGKDINKASSWRNTWARELYLNPEARKVFAHKTNLSTNKKSYMRNMTHLDYIIGSVAEYFAEEGKGDRVPAWFRVTILSNKPSADYIRFYSERGENYKKTLVRNFKLVVDQELSRIQTVLLRNRQKGDADFIKSFDTRGKEFQFLTALNKFLAHSKKADEALVNSRVGKLLNDKVNGKQLSPEAEAELYNALIGIGDVKGIIETSIDAEIERTLNKWEHTGVIKFLAKKINGLNESNVREQLTNFLWNDKYAQVMIQELTITDPAFFKDTDDLQKRAAQLHAPGIRGNKLATDYEGNRVTDGFQRDVVIADFDKVVSSAIDNVTEVFNRKIANAPANMKAQYTALRDSIVKQFKDINVTDAQAYNSPSSYRKKAIMFGKWNKQFEEVYKKLKNGTYTYSDLKTAFQPLKPFKYTQNSENMRVENAPLNTHKMPVQNKNAEYLLIMADALTRNEDTSKPNLLKVLYDIMEESADGRVDGIDTIQFNSAVKSGERGVIDLRMFTEVSEGNTKEDMETAAKEYMESLIYANKETHAYNDIFVNQSDFDNFSIQQEVPEHFKDHSQPIGSQNRYIIPSDLADTMIVDGKEVKATYNVEGKPLTRDEFKAEYEKTNAENIALSTQELIEEFKLGSEYTQEERNAAMSKALQEQIEGSPRYGADLWLSCSIENGEFLIPEGDPIQAKMIEQMKNSLVKNGINKQKMAGGPIVQVSNFGTSRQLNIRFKKKGGGLLQTRSEFAKENNLTSQKEIDAAYKKYVSENQAGIAYGEVYAPIPNDAIFENFVDENGVIDVEAIEKTNPELLQMIGYRIPTEAKYSIMPLKIVGFLPREAGEAIMLPYDITLITGSDFDVDKEYVQRKEINVYRKKNSEVRPLLKEAILKEIDNYPHSKEAIEYAKKAASKRLNDVLFSEYRKAANSDKRFGGGVLSDAEKTELRNEYYKENKDKIKQWYNEAIADYYVNNYLGNIESITASYRIENRDKREGINRLLDSVYRKNGFTSSKATSGRTYNNNKIFDMSYEVLTHETNASECLTPGGFEEPKQLAYTIEAVRRGLITFEQAKKLSNNELKDLITEDKDLTSFDTQVEYYKQNVSAGTILGMFAVQKIAHAVLEGDNITIDFDNIGDGLDEIVIAGFSMNSDTILDNSTNQVNNSIGLILGSGVAASADAAKEPTMSYMNINSNTMGVYSTLIRMGIPNDVACMFMSTAPIGEMIDRNSSNNLTKSEFLTKTIQDEIDAITKDIDLVNSAAATEELTLQEIQDAIRMPYESLDVKTKYKILNTFLRVNTLANELKELNFVTRFNSISNAVGPLIIDNLIMEYRLSQFPATLKVNGMDFGLGDLFTKHPILREFANTLNVSRALMGNMPANSESFRRITNQLTYSERYKEIGKKLMRDRTLLSKFSDFYQSYVLIAGENPVIDASKLDYYIHQFPRLYLKNTSNGEYTDNSIVKAIRLNVNKKGHSYLGFNTTGLERYERESLSGGWADLANHGDKGKKMANELFDYNFFRRGIGFSPETFMSMYPLALKLSNTKYLDTYRHLPVVSIESLLDCFIRNNTSLTKLCPVRDLTVTDKQSNTKYDDLVETKGTDGKMYRVSSDSKVIGKYKNLLYFTGKGIDGKLKLYRQSKYSSDTTIAFEEISPLGNDGEYLEMSTGIIDKPLSETVMSEDNFMSDEEFGGETEDSSKNGMMEAPTQEPTQEEILRQRRARIFDIYARANNPMLAIQTARRLADTPNRKNIIKFLENRLKEMGENVTEENINQTIEDLNLC